MPPNVFESTPANVFEDGTWGYREWTREPQLLDARAPYLAALAVPSASFQGHLYARRPLKDEMEPVPECDGFYRLSRKITAEFGKTFRNVRATLKDVLKSFENTRSQYKDLEIVDPPTLAVCYALASLTAMRCGELRSFSHFVAFWRAHQRAVLEMEAFINWWDRYFEVQPRDMGFNLWYRRGVIVSNEEMERYWPIIGDRMGLPIFTTLDVEVWDVPCDRRCMTSSLALYSVSVSAELSKS